MTVGFAQILLIVLIFILLFGNFSKILKDIAEGIKSFQNTFKDK